LNGWASGGEKANNRWGKKSGNDKKNTGLAAGWRKERKIWVRGGGKRREKWLLEEDNEAVGRKERGEGGYEKREKNGPGKRV